MIRPRHDRRMLLAGAVGTVAMSAVLAACSSGAASTATGPAGPSGSNRTAASVAVAKGLVAQAERGLVYSAVDSDQPLASIAPLTSWRGPTRSIKPTPGVKLEFVICAAGTSCATVSDIGQNVAKEIGWSAHTIAGSGDAASYNAAMDTALSRNPNVIICVGIPGTLIADKLQQARSRGIVTISAPDVPSAGVSAQPYDGYVSYRQPLQQQIMAADVIANSDGRGHAIEVESTDQPDSVEGAKQFRRVMASCSGCKTYVTPWTIAQASDPSSAAEIIQAALAAHPDVDYIVLPYEIGLPAVISAVQQAADTGRVKILVKDGSQIELQALSRGQVFAVTGVGLDWLAYAALYQASLGVAHLPYLNAYDQGLGVHLFTKTNTPANDTADYSRWMNFAAHYDALWGAS